MSFFSEQESGELREARVQVAELVGRELALRAEVERLAKQNANLLAVYAANRQLDAEVERLRAQDEAMKEQYGGYLARAERAEAALRLCVLKRRGGTTADANVADEDIGEYVKRADASARAALAGEVKGGWDEVYGDPKRWLAGEGKP